jgi:hypothetical protein
MTGVSDVKPKPVDAVALLADLARWWDNPQPVKYGHGVPGRIAGGRYDQNILRGTQNPYWEIIRQMPLETMGSSFGTHRPEPTDHLILADDDFRQFADRRNLCATFSWSIPSPLDIAWIKKRLKGRGIIEPGAGLGYWAWQLTQAGVDVAAYELVEWADNAYAAREPWFPVLPGDHDAPRHHPDRAMLLCWPSYSEPWASWSLSSYTGNQLFYVGEGPGGCCADDGFFDLLEAEWEEVDICPAHISWWGIHCYLTEYRRLRA